MEAEKEIIDFIQKAIDKIPWLFWLILVMLFLWGFILILKQIYGFCHQARKNYITELKEHLDLKEAIINDISEQKAQLENQNHELMKETCRKDEIINATVEKAVSIITERETELKKIRDDKDATEVIIRHLRYALGTAFWIVEREMFMRRIFLTLLARSTVSADINNFLSKNIGSIISMIESDEEMWFREIDIGTTSDFLELKSAVLSDYYLQLPITKEIDLFTSLTNDIRELPSFINAKDVVDDDKN